MKTLFTRSNTLAVLGMFAVEVCFGALLLATSATASGLCDVGTAQSPVNLQNGMTKDRKASVSTRYSTGEATIVNTGKTIQIDFPKGNSITVEGKRFDLLQMHMHSPAENKIDGVLYPLEAHFVHQAADGKLAVVGVVFKEGKTNNAYASIFSQMPAVTGESRALTNVDPSALLPKSRKVFSYIGSLTTPPCDEGVSWFVRKQVLELSSEQVEVFTKLYRSNARPIQPLNGRIVFSE